MRSHASSLAIEGAYSTPAEQKAVLPQLVGFYFAFRLFTVLLTVRVFGGDAKTGAALGVVLNLLLLLIVIFHSLGSARAALATSLRIANFRWVILFLVLSGCSLLWSETVSLAAALAYWCSMVADVAMVVLLMRTGPATRMMSSAMAGYVYGACLIAAIAWILPAQSDLRLGDEELLGPNQIGYACAFAALFAQYLAGCRQGRWKFAAVFLSITLLRSLSKTTIFAFMAAEVFWLLRDSSIARKTKIYFIVSALVVIAIFSELLLSYYSVYTNAGNQAETLTGRLGIWAFILDRALQQPWIGHGFHSVWKVIPPFGSDQFEARHAHNELLQQFYAYGVVGVVMLVGIYRSFYLGVRKFPAGPLKTFAFSMLVFALFRGLADTEVFDLSLPLWLMSMICLQFVSSPGFQEGAHL